jgi:hypothetical protein
MRASLSLGAILLVGVAIAAIVVSVTGRAGGSAGAAADADLFESEHIVFRSLEPGREQGRIAYVPAAEPAGTRKLATPRCLRVAAAGGRAVCLRTGRTPAQPYEVVALDERLEEVGDEPLSGVPSRARISPDGRRFATTVFVSGHNYISLGFSTETMLYERDGTAIGNLEHFTFLINGEKDASVDRNVWGVTFTSDSNTFFATVAAGGRTYLARGDVGARTLTALQDNAECPSLSPDERTLVYKKRVNPAADQAWRFHALNLETGEETPLGERRSIDDQAAWLDDERVMYAVPTHADGQASADIWVAPIDGGPARRLIRDADSPTLVGGRS